VLLKISSDRCKMCMVVSMCTNKNEDWFQDLKVHSIKICIRSIQLKEKCCLL